MKYCIAGMTHKARQAIIKAWSAGITHKALQAVTTNRMGRMHSDMLWKGAGKKRGVRAAMTDRFDHCYLREAGYLHPRFSPTSQ